MKIPVIFHQENPPSPLSSSFFHNFCILFELLGACFHNFCILYSWYWYVLTSFFSDFLFFIFFYQLVTVVQRFDVEVFVLVPFNLWVFPLFSASSL